MHEVRIVGEVSRRTLGTLVAVGAVTVLAGCDDDGTAGPVLPVDPVADPDVALTVDAWAAETRLLNQVRAAQRRHPRLRRRLASTRATHAAHVRELARAAPAEELPPVSDTASAPARPTAALRALTRAEEALARSQSERAVRARSGPLARVLAGTAAAAAQQAHLLGTQL